MYAIQTRQLRKSYHTGRSELEVLHGIDLDIARGEFVSIMGPSGSGKSTLLNMIGLLDIPSSGRMRLMERDVANLSKNARAIARRQALGFIFQSFHLQARASAMQNVMLPMALAGIRRSKRKGRAMQLLRAVGLEDRARFKPSELSGGQKQRVAIARALALDPPIILADEATGNLDSSTSKEIMELFQRLHGAGKTIVQVTHDSDMAAYGTRTLQFGDGIIVQDLYRPEAY